MLNIAAVKYIADDLKDRGVFNNMLIAVFLSIVGIVVGSLVVLGTVFSAFQNGYFIGANFAPSTSVTTAQWISFGTAIGLGLLGAWVFWSCMISRSVVLTFDVLFRYSEENLTEESAFSLLWGRFNSDGRRLCNFFEGARDAGNPSFYLLPISKVAYWSCFANCR